LPKRLDTKANKKERAVVDGEDFTPEFYREDGPAAMAMCRWVKAIYNYMDVAKVMMRKGLSPADMK